MGFAYRADLGLQQRESGTSGRSATWTRTSFTQRVGCVRATECRNGAASNDGMDVPGRCGLHPRPPDLPMADGPAISRKGRAV